MLPLTPTLATFLLLNTGVFSNPVYQRTTAPDKTLVKRVDPSPYPYGDALDNEFQWRNWDKDNEEDKKDGQRIHKAFEEWHDFAKSAHEAASNKDGDTFKRWFGTQDDPDEIKKVIENMIDPTTWKATDKVAKMVLDRTDFTKKEANCEAKPTMNAYTMADTGEFHVCPYGLKKNLNSEHKCENFDDSCSEKMRSIPMFLLHEMTHYDEIGADARGGLTIIDEASGAYKCFKLDDDDKGDNAQNYAWLAGEAYWSGQCKKTFKDPSEGTAIEIVDDFKWIYTCAPYIGDREGEQCSCDPQGCEIGTPDCTARALVKGKNGCDDQCNGCVVPQ